MLSNLSSICYFVVTLHVFGVSRGQGGWYLMLRLMWAGLALLFLVPVIAEGGEGLWLAGLERGLDPGWEGGGWAGVSPDGEVDWGGVHCHASESPP